MLARRINCSPPFHPSAFFPYPHAKISSFFSTSPLGASFSHRRFHGLGVPCFCLRIRTWRKRRNLLFKLQRQNWTPGPITEDGTSPQPFFSRAFPRRSLSVFDLLRKIWRQRGGVRGGILRRRTHWTSLIFEPGLQQGPRHLLCHNRCDRKNCSDG